VLAWIEQVTALGHRVMAAIARSLDLPGDYFARRYTGEPLILFRIFQYPSRPVPAGLDVRDGVGEHTDYGLLTLLRQDSVGGLEVKAPRGWIQAPPVAESFVCNIGDMLDRMTGGTYRSTPHRVRLNTSGRDRLSFPLFFDPDLDARIEPIRSAGIDDRATRWDRASVHAFEGTYGDYLLGKIGKVFPELRRQVL
jgi:polar amino acid transport system ATP-binding protein